MVLHEGDNLLFDCGILPVILATWLMSISGRDICFSSLDVRYDVAKEDETTEEGIRCQRASPIQAT